ncbi:MAG: hypothetical protein AAGJ86_03090 [Pseudomonadota bacterium]
MQRDVLCSNEWRRATIAALVAAVLCIDALAYEPDPALRKSLGKTVKQELIEATPQAQRLSVRLSFSPRVSLRDYERLAKKAGFPAYADCSIATFVEVTNWQIIQGKDVTPEQIKQLVASCESATTTAIGPKPIPQAQGDREILRGMWQRNLAFVGKSLRDEALSAFIRKDAAQQFYQIHGEPDEWHLTAKGFQRKPMAPVVAAEVPAEPGGAIDESGVVAPPAPESTSSTSTLVYRQTDEDFDIVMRTVTRYGLSGVYVENEIYLRLKDGRIKRRFSENPYALDTQLSAARDPENWGNWSPSNASLQVKWPGDASTVWERWFMTRPAQRGQRISGLFQSADGFGGGRVANFNTVAFDADGRFTWAALKGGDTGGWLPAYDDRRRAGRYSIDGHAIRLTFNDGTVEEYAFCFYPKDNEHFVIGSNHFTPLD